MPPLFEGDVSGVDFGDISALRTKMWISRAVVVGSSNFWVFWKAENVLLRLCPDFYGARSNSTVPLAENVGSVYLKLTLPK